LWCVSRSGPLGNTSVRGGGLKGTGLFGGVEVVHASQSPCTLCHWIGARDLG